MKTKMLGTSESDLQQAAAVIKAGGTVVFPTETVYGLGANALDADAVSKIFLAKGRPADNPLIVHIADTAMLDQLAVSVPKAAYILADAFWPGPLTIILRRGKCIPDAVTAGLDTVGIRMPAEPVAQRLITLAGVPIAAPSANRSGLPSPTTAADAAEDMDGRVDAIINGPACGVGVESTVLDLSGERPILFRPGGITLEQLTAAIGEIQLQTELADKEAPRSPGLKYKHYAPRAEVAILHGDVEQVQAFLRSQKKKTGMLVFDEFESAFDGLTETFSLGSRKQPEEAAHRLFHALRALDARGVKAIYAPEIPETGLWRAVKNRLYRAAGNRILDVTAPPACEAQPDKAALADKSEKEILFVCTGNTCRSPMAEGLCNVLAAQAGLPIRAISAGIFAGGGAPSENAQLAMKKEGVDISARRAVQLTPDMVKRADVVLTMTDGHRRAVLAMVPEAAEKVYSLSDFAGVPGEVADPYGGDAAEYERCCAQLKELVTLALEKLR